MKYHSLSKLYATTLIDETNIDIILETLWAIKEDDKFYFMAYGKEMIEDYITNKIKQNEHRNS
jgi:hypothetical protein